MRDCLLLVDVFNDFRHEDGDRLLESFTSRFSGLECLVRSAREEDRPIVFANDPHGIFDGDARAIVERARAGLAGPMVDRISPAPGDRFVVKPRYSAFDHTPLELILREFDVERLVLAGMSTEGCVTQTAIAAREVGFQVTVDASACATVDPQLEAIALAYLARVVGVYVEGADLLSGEPATSGAR